MDLQFEKENNPGAFACSLCKFDSGQQLRAELPSLQTCALGRNKRCESTAYSGEDSPLPDLRFPKS